ATPAYVISRPAVTTSAASAAGFVSWKLMLQPSPTPVSAESVDAALALRIVRRPRRRRSAFEQALPDRVAHELRPAREMELLHDVRAVRLRGAHRDVQLLRDLLVRVSEREQTQHLALAFGERVFLRLPRRGGLGRDQACAELRVDI